MYCTEPVWGAAFACRYHYIQKKLVHYKIPDTAIPILIKRLEAQNFKCFYTGVPLAPGVNMALDHYHSVKRNPDLANDVNNLVWADEDANNMKRHASIPELLSFCEAVVANKAAILAGVPPVAP
jgi:hypothetical protein